MPNVLVVGATRGLGAALVTYYASKPDVQVYATSRSSDTPSSPSGDNIHWVGGIDLSAGPNFVNLAQGITVGKLDTVIITAGYFATEEFGESKWEEEIKMYTLSSVAPVFVVEALVKKGKLGQGSKLILVSSESG